MRAVTSEAITSAPRTPKPTANGDHDRRDRPGVPIAELADAGLLESCRVRVGDGGLESVLLEVGLADSSGVDGLCSPRRRSLFVSDTGLPISPGHLLE